MSSTHVSSAALRTKILSFGGGYDEICAFEWRCFIQCACWCVIDDDDSDDEDDDNDDGDDYMMMILVMMIAEITAEYDFNITISSITQVLCCIA